MNIISHKTGCLRNLARYFTHKAKSEELTFRNARADDKEEVMSLSHNVYRGLDYLPDSFDYFLRDENRQCLVGELGGKMVVFGVMLTLDGGQAIVGQAGRVHERFRGRGFFRAITGLLNMIARENGCRARVAMVETTLNEYARSEKFKKTHVEIATKLHYAGVVTHLVRESLQHIVESCRTSFNTIHEVTDKTLQNCVNCDEVKQYLFPGDKILVDYVPYQTMTDNIPLIRGRNTKFFSSIQTSGTSNDISGLLTAGSDYRCNHPPESYTIDIFGSDSSDLELHVLFHLARALERSGEFCLQIFVEKGFIAQELCKTLIKLDIPKCHWYVEGGVTSKTVVEEVLT